MKSKLIKGLAIFIKEVRLAGKESYNKVIKHITYNSFIKIILIANIFFALLMLFNKITAKNNDH
jgi:hypothetical protein